MDEVGWHCREFDFAEAFESTMLQVFLNHFERTRRVIISRIHRPVYGYVDKDKQFRP
jgi:hypothetical protein